MEFNMEAGPVVKPFEMPLSWTTGPVTGCPEDGRSPGPPGSSVAAGAPTRDEAIGNYLAEVGHQMASEDGHDSRHLVVTVLLGIFMALPVTMVTMGVKYLEECPREPKIPIYLLVGGCFGLLKVMSMVWKQVRSRRYERLDDIYDGDDGNGDMIMSKSSRFSEAVLSVFLFAWFLQGNYWVLHIWKPHFRQLLHDPSNWCDQTVYVFAFGQIMGCYGLMALILLLSCVLVICHRCSAAFDKS